MKRSSVFIIVGLFLLQIACQTITAAFPTARPTAPDVAEAMPAGEANLTCIGAYGYGVTCIENNEWVNYSKDSAGLGSDLVEDIALCPDGDLLVLHALGLNRFDGAQWRNYGQGWGYESVKAVACDADDNFWVAHYRGVSYFHDGTWQTYTVKETLSTDPEAYESVNDIAIAPDGAVWVVLVNGIAVFAEEEWTVYEKGAGFDDKYFFERIAFDSHGDPWVVSSGGLHHYDGLFWNFHPSQGFFLTPQSIAVDHQDRIWIGTLAGGLVLYENQAWLTFTPQNSALASYNVNALATDAAGRLWVGTQWGLNVIDEETWTSYWLSNSDLPDDDIAVIAVAGAGSALPATQKKAPGAITGRLVDADGNALANAALEVCVETIYNSYQGDTPCEGHPYTRNAASDADGAFTIENLPAGFYNLAIQTGETWLLYSSRSSGVSERFLVPAGETTDLGEITVSAE